MLTLTHPSCVAKDQDRILNDGDLLVLLHKIRSDEENLNLGFTWNRCVSIALPLERHISGYLGCFVFPFHLVFACRMHCSYTLIGFVVQDEGEETTYSNRNCIVETSHAQEAGSTRQAH